MTRPGPQDTDVWTSIELASIVQLLYENPKKNRCAICGAIVTTVCPLCADCLMEEDDYLDHQDMVRDLGPMLY